MKAWQDWFILNFHVIYYLKRWYKLLDGYFTKGTNKDKFLTHYGWDNCTQCIVSRKVFSTGYTWVLKDKTENPEERYIFDINGELNSGVHVY